MKRRGFLIGLLVAVALSATAWGFEPYFSDAAGNKLGQVWEGQQVYIAVKDPDKGACGIAEFQADLVIFDFKTGAYVYVEETGAWFRELGGIGSGLYFWVKESGSNSKVAVQVGSRADFTTVPGGQTHVLGTISPGDFEWAEGAWEYVDEDTFTTWPTSGSVPTVVDLPADRTTARVDFAGLTAGTSVLPASTTGGIAGRFENNDTLVLIVADQTDERNIDQAQVKIVDTTVKLTVTPAQVAYGCGAACGDIIVKIEDPDENLNCNQIEYVPFFVIVNPGSWNPQTSSINNFCSLMLRGGYDPGAGADLNQPIRWYNIYDEPVAGGTGWTGVNSRWIQYPPTWLDGGRVVGRALFFAAETAVDSGVFEFNFGNLDQLQAALGFKTFTPGTTIAFYYIDPNDFDDMWLATIVVGDRAHSQTFITDANGIPVDTVKIGWGGLYVRVYDADANVEACCQDKVVVHICDPHNEDDSEYYVIDEVSNDSGIFFTQSGIPLDPVWDAVGGYQLVFDDWRIQAFNEDTIFVRYNSVAYVAGDLNALGDGNPNDGSFPPAIDETAARNQPWDVSFDLVKVYDFQVFDGTTHRMRFLDGSYKPVTEIPVSGSLYLEVTDLDQNEDPLLRELIFGGWNKDTDAAHEGSDPIWWQSAGNSDVMTPQGAVTDPAPTFLGATDGDGDANVDESITSIPETVKVFMWNAQRGTWERIDLRETAVGSGVFRSTTCVLVADARHPGDGNLASKPGDTIMAFYQDPSNHSDISIISIKVSEGGAGGITPPVVALSVAFDRTTYYPGDTVTITVTDDQYAGAGKIVGAAKVLVLKDKDGAELASWTEIPEVAGQPGKFRVTYVLPQTVKLGTITAVYTDPIIATRTAQASATVAAAALTNVTGISITPNPFATSTTFAIVAQPTGAVADKLTITIYDLTGHKVGEVSGTNTGSVTWTGGTLRNGAYIYVAVVEGGSPTKVWTFRGFVYIKR